MYKATLLGGAILPVYSLDLGLAIISPNENTKIPANTIQPVTPNIKTEKLTTVITTPQKIVVKGFNLVTK